MANIKVKFKEAYQDFGAYALLKNVTDKGVLIVDGTEVLNSIADLPTTNTVDGQEKAVIVQNGQVVTTSINNIGGGGGGGSPAGSDTQIQYNNAGAFGADSNFYRNLTSNQTGIFNTYDLGGSVFTTTGFWNLNNASLMFSKLDADPTSNVIFRSDASELKATVSSSSSGNTNALQVSQTNIIVGNISGGNNTKITIDDVNEQITISNLSAYDDDTAAGVGGLTAGMVYMTTGSGSAPLNAAGILMIKQ